MVESRTEVGGWLWPEGRAGVGACCVGYRKMRGSHSMAERQEDIYLLGGGFKVSPEV